MAAGRQPSTGPGDPAQQLPPEGVVRDEPWDAEWLPEWVNDAGPLSAGPLSAEPLSAEPLDEPVPDPEPPAVPDTAEQDLPAPTPGRRPLPPRIGAALEEFREAQLAAERAAEEQAAARLAAWQDAIQAGDELAARAAVSSEPSAAPVSDPADVPTVRTPPSVRRRRARVLLPLVVIALAAVIAGFTLPGSEPDRPEVAAAEQDTPASSQSPPGPEPASQPVRPVPSPSSAATAAEPVADTPAASGPTSAPPTPAITGGAAAVTATSVDAAPTSAGTPSSTAPLIAAPVPESVLDPDFDPDVPHDTDGVDPHPGAFDCPAGEDPVPAECLPTDPTSTPTGTPTATPEPTGTPSTSTPSETGQLSVTEPTATGLLGTR